MPDDPRDQPADEAGLLKRLLQGRWLGHPLHPMLVHLPIALWVLSFVLDVVAFARDDEYVAYALQRAAFYTLVTGLGFAVLAAVTGFADYTDVRRDHPARRTANWHMILNLCAVAVFTLSALYRRHQDKPDVLPTAISGIGVILVSISGYLGGVMVYADGLGVGRHRRRHEVRATKHVDAPADDGYVPVLDADDLPDGIPTRAEVNGHALVLLRLRGELHAFQEFCTHRFGPLSEGTVEGANIMCPWHRSCFEVRTGKVVSGPAKVDLKTYPVRERDGRICVNVSK